MNEFKKSVGLDVFLLSVSGLGVISIALDGPLDMQGTVSIIAYSILIGVAGTMAILKLKGDIKVNNPTEKQLELKARNQKWILGALAILTIGVIFWGKL